MTTTTEATIAPAINVLDPDFYIDPYPAYRWLRDHSPVHWDPVQQLWAISRYDDVVHIEKRTELYSSLDGSRPKTNQRSDTSMINKDDPEHHRQRMHVARRFTPRAVANHEERVRRLVRELIDEVAPRGECEAIDALAAPLPAMVIGEMLGYPRELWPKVREWSEITMHEAGQTRSDGQRVENEHMSEAVQDFAMTTMGIIAERRAQPRDDLISAWCAKEVDGRTWTDQEVLAECILLLDGGAETTRTVIGGIILELARQPEQRQRLLDHPELLEHTAVEEFIRWVTPILNMRRTVTTDHVFHDQQLHAGDEVLLMYAAANRDDRAFAEPETFDVTRSIKQHVAFGFGTHFCLGASLARLEIRVMFEELLTRMPDWRIAPGAEPRIVPATFTRGYDRIPIEFSPAS